jgi:hypothetical protein
MARFFKEPPMACGPSVEEAYRLLWWRTFHAPISITIARVRNVASVTTVELTMVDGRPQPAINRVIHRTLSADEWKVALKALDRLEVWVAKSDLPNLGLMDGSAWVIEARLGDDYHVIWRRSPQDAPTRNIGLILLRLANVTVAPEEFY